WVVPGVEVTKPWSLVLAALAVGVGDALLRPVLRRLARRSGVVGALVSGVLAQLVVAWAALTYLPGFRSGSWADVLAVLVLAAVLMALGRWVVGANDNEYVLGDVLRRARRVAGVRGAAAGEDATAQRPAGLLVVLLDGVSRPTLDDALQAGLAPTLARWLGSGSPRLATWWARVPATMPAST